jgi:hypothetical protein
MPRDFFPRRGRSGTRLVAELPRSACSPIRRNTTSRRSRRRNYAQLHDDFAAKLQLRLSPGTATRPATVAKNAARKALEKQLRSMAGQIRARRDIAVVDKTAIGLRERKTKQTRWPKPDTAPGIYIRDIRGRTVSIQLTDQPTGRPGKPQYVTAASVFYHVGETAPAARDKWTLAGQSSRSRLSVTLPTSIPPGARVWFTAFWSNRRCQSGPAARAVMTYMSYGTSIALGVRHARAA